MGAIVKEKDAEIATLKTELADIQGAIRTAATDGIRNKTEIAKLNKELNTLLELLSSIQAVGTFFLDDDLYQSVVIGDHTMYRLPTVEGESDVCRKVREKAELVEWAKGYRWRWYAILKQLRRFKDGEKFVCYYFVYNVVGFTCFEEKSCKYTHDVLLTPEQAIEKILAAGMDPKAEVK